VFLLSEAVCFTKNFMDPSGLLLLPSPLAFDCIPGASRSHLLRTSFSVPPSAKRFPLLPLLPGIPKLMAFRHSPEVIAPPFLRIVKQALGFFPPVRSYTITFLPLSFKLSNRSTDLPNVCISERIFLLNRTSVAHGPHHLRIILIGPAPFNVNEDMNHFSLQHLSNYPLD